MRVRFNALLSFWSFWLLLALSLGAQDRAGFDFFEQRIRPILFSECYECHAGEKRKGGLLLDSRAGWMKGGDSGPAILRQDPGASLLIKSIKHLDPDLKMPEKRPKLSDRVIADFEAWIQMGAPDPRERPDSTTAATATNWDQIREVRRQWWSLQPLRKVSIPASMEGASHPIDRFLRALWKEQGLPAPLAADRRTFIRRLSFTLTGLPPTSAQTQQFLEDTRADATVHLVDHFLASPAFGEHWARKWMDLVRYAETHGSEGDPEIRNAWRYRDYLIRAFNQDVPWNQLVLEHVAGDLLENPRLNAQGDVVESKIGPAHLRLVEHGFQPIDALEDQVRVVENQIDVLGKAFQGLTIACARCHDHKFDAVSQRDYTALYGVLASARPALVTIDAPAILAAEESTLTQLKANLREALGQQWIVEMQNLPQRIAEIQASEVELQRSADRLKELQTRQLALTQIAGDKGTVGGTTTLSLLRGMIARWSFNQDATEEIKQLNGELLGGAKIQNGRLVLNGNGAVLRTAPLNLELKEKSLEVWVTLPDAHQRGGGVMTVESLDGTVFDSIVFAEREAGEWMVGSDFGRRTESLGGPIESAGKTLVHLVATFRADGLIALYRNGVLYGKSYTPRNPEGNSPVAFDLKAHLLFGQRHTGGGQAFYKGEIEEARLYDRTISAEEVAGSFRAGHEGIRSELITEALPAELKAEWMEVVQSIQKTKAQIEALQSNASRAQTLRAALEPSKPSQTDRPLGVDYGSSYFESIPLGTLWQVGAGAEWGPDWFHHGREARVTAGDFAVDLSGPLLFSNLLTRGVYSHLISPKRPGHLTSPRFRISTDFISLLAAGENGAAVRLVVDHYPIGVNNTFPKVELNQKEAKWYRLDTNYRKGAWAYLEAVSGEDLVRKDDRRPTDGRSWFGIQKVFFHNDGAAPGEARVIPRVGEESSKSSLSPESLSSRIAPPSLLPIISRWKSGGQISVEEVKQINRLLRTGFLTTAPNSESLRALQARYRAVEGAIALPRRVPGVVESRATDAALMIRGDHLKPGVVVPRGYLEVLGSASAPLHQSGRLEVARQMVASTNPLTPRVLANRIWQQTFGEGIVASVDNFGRLGELPMSPELLDFLAQRFMDDGWSLKRTLRLLVTSQAFQARSEPSPEALEKDPHNRFLSHFSVRRLPAEAIRDSLLMLSGRADSTAYGPPVQDTRSGRRSVYLAVRRTDLNPFLQIFDAPKPFTTLGRRDNTVVPAQSLTLLNDPFVIDIAKSWAGRFLKSGADLATEEGREKLIAGLFLEAFHRSPTDTELKTSLEYLNQSVGGSDRSADASAEAVKDLAHALLNLKEFIYVP